MFNQVLERNKEGRGVASSEVAGVLLTDEHGKAVAAIRGEAFSRPDAADNIAMIAASRDMRDALQTIGAQSLGPDWTAEQALAFIKKLARETSAKARCRGTLT